MQCSLLSGISNELKVTIEWDARDSGTGFTGCFCPSSYHFEFPCSENLDLLDSLSDFFSLLCVFW